MKLLIIGAMHEEIQFVLEHIRNQNQNMIHGFTFYEGTYEQHQLVIVESGIGKVMAGILIASAIAIYDTFDYVINIGVAGGVNGVQIGDVIVGRETVYGDVDVSYFRDYRYGQLPRFPFLYVGHPELIKIAVLLGGRKGTICTMDRFVIDKTFVDELIQTHFSDLEILCFDMETAAFAQSCQFFQIPFMAIRTISDVVGSQKQTSEYEHNLEMACKNSGHFVIELIKKI